MPPFCVVCGTCMTTTLGDHFISKWVALVCDPKLFCERVPRGVMSRDPQCDLHGASGWQVMGLQRIRRVRGWQLCLSGHAASQICRQFCVCAPQNP